MFRKILSNRDPKDTLLSQLKIEFSPYFEKISVAITQRIRRKPKLIFGAMVAAIFLSAGLSFTLFRNSVPSEAGKRLKQVRVNVISDGFDQISTTARTIQQTLHLKQQIDSLSSKRALSKADSDVLESDLDQLRQLNQSSKP